MVRIRLDKNLLTTPLPENSIFESTGSNDLIFQVSPEGNVLETLEHNGLKLLRPVTAVINGQAADLYQKLVSGDEVYLLAQIAGGD